MNEYLRQHQINFKVTEHKFQQLKQDAVTAKMSVNYIRSFPGQPFGAAIFQKKYLPLLIIHLPVDASIGIIGLNLRWMPVDAVVNFGFMLVLLNFRSLGQTQIAGIAVDNIIILTDSFGATLTSWILAKVATMLCIMLEPASTPMCAFIPKYHWLPFLVWCISGSRAFFCSWQNWEQR